MSTNFTFLQKDFPILYNLALGAEYNLYEDPVSSLVKMRQFVEKMVGVLYQAHFMEFPYNSHLATRIKQLEYDGILPDRLRDLCFSINKKGNIAAHDVKGSTQDAIGTLLTTFKVAKWLSEIYGSEDIDLSQKRFSKPENMDARHALYTLEQDYAELESKFNKLLDERDTSGLEKGISDQIKAKAHRLARNIDMSEAETRELIDQQLRDAGWEVDTEAINFKKHKTLPQRGKNLAIAEWRIGKKWADYALFVGTELYALVEAKKYAEDISTNLHQAKIYAELATEDNGVRLLGKWRTYKVPFLFSTNGRKYLKQLETKSGIWHIDIRNERNNARSLKGWYSPEGIVKLYKQDLSEAEDKLKNRELDFLESKNGLSLRDYQLNAIKAVEKVLLDAPNREKVLLAMATGTGKTRTIIGLCYRLISTNRFRRILFLVDRRMLATQAIDSFKDNKVEGTLSFKDSYKIEELKTLIPDMETRLHFATVQSMVKRLFYTDDESDVLPIDTYDCIIVDEAHRGYLLDREMDDEELLFKNEDDYISLYSKVIDYFDAFTVGLTATPALHTSEIFGKPIYNYSYREAVLDGWLIDHNPPVNIKTKLSEQGILWEQGETPNAYDAETNEVIELDSLEDELHLEIAQFNKGVITEPWNRAVISHLVKQIDPEGEEKTLVFASNDNHADLVVKIFFEEYKKLGIDVPDDAIVKITGKAYAPDTLLKRYKNEKYPTIVVTVDLLTTGIDVPAICNLVFLRRVRSRILYEQMLGRATRRCDDIDKDAFYIYDAVRLYEALEKVTNMKPVVVNPTTTITQLAEEMPSIQSEERIAKQVEQIIAKIHRKKKLITVAQLEQFEHLTKGYMPDDFLRLMQSLHGKQGQSFVTEYPELWPWLDNIRPPKQYQLVSDHKDEITDVSVMYHGYQKPEDYIQGFTDYIENNKNKIAALNLVCTKPTLLDRKSLKDLKMELDAQGFNSKMLNQAWKETKNEDIAADIISYIRTLALGSELVDHDTRMTNAMQKIYQMKDWNAVQKKWLDRFEKKLKAESVLQKEDLDLGAFSDAGGYKRINKIFNEEIDEVIQAINENLYKETA